MILLLLVAGAFLSGSLMFSYWLGQLLNKNIRSVGDGNPGAINLWKASGMKFGLLGIALDFAKGYVPVRLFEGATHGYGIVPLALAPIAGHAFSPFLKGRGGKAIAVTFGVWSALTEFDASLAYAVAMAMLVILFRAFGKITLVSAQADALQVAIGMLIVGVYLYARGYAGEILWIWFGNLVLLTFKHRAELIGLLRRERDHDKGITS